MNTKNLTIGIVLLIGLFTSCEYIDYDWNDNPPKNRKTVETDFLELVENELAFAELTSSTSIKEGFLEFLADDGIVFRGDFVLGKPFYEPQEPTPTILSWKPVTADISRSGDFGYTSGPYEIRPTSLEEEPVSWGEYVSLWERQNDDSWKVVFDLGARYDNPGQSFPDIEFPNTFPLKINIDRDTEKLQNELLETAIFFGNISNTESLKNAYRRFLSTETRLIREGNIPITAYNEVRALVDNAAQQPMFEVVDAKVSSVGDFGYTYGFSTLDGERRPYVHIWKFDKLKAWRIVLEMSSIPVTPVA